MLPKWFARLVGGSPFLAANAFRRQVQRRPVALPTLESLEDRIALSSLSQAPTLPGGSVAASNVSAALDPRASGNLAIPQDSDDRGRSSACIGGNYPLPPATGPALNGSLLASRPPAAVFLSGPTTATVTDSFSLGLVPTLLSTGSGRPASASAAAAVPAGLGERLENTSSTPVVHPGNAVPIGPAAPADIAGQPAALPAAWTPWPVGVQGPSSNGLVTALPQNAEQRAERPQAPNSPDEFTWVASTADDTAGLPLLGTQVEETFVTPAPVRDFASAGAELTAVADDAEPMAETAVARTDPGDSRERSGGETDSAPIRGIRLLDVTGAVGVGLLVGYLFTPGRVPPDEKNRQPQPPA
jgi:hypothetical protein